MAGDQSELKELNEDQQDFVKKYKATKEKTNNKFPITREAIEDIDENGESNIVISAPVGMNAAKPALNIEIIKKYICHDATDDEAYAFLQLCLARGLNPFLKEAYLIKYDKTSTATMVVGKDAFVKRAELHPSFKGFQAGIIVANKDGTIVEREGSFLFDGDTLLGGWANVYRKDRDHPFVSKVSMKEYGTGKSTWQKMPAVMIRKVALVGALRESFPSEFSGCYDASEVGLDL